MSKSINQVTLVGHVGKEPDVKTISGDVRVASFSLATSSGGYKKADGTEVPEVTQWHNIVLWRGLADIAARFVHKGDKLMIVGSIRYREYESDGVKKYATDIIADDLVLMSGVQPNVQNPQPVAQQYPQQQQPAYAQSYQQPAMAYAPQYPQPAMPYPAQPQPAQPQQGDLPF